MVLFKKHLENSNRYEAALDFDSAVEEAREAWNLATVMKWGDGVVIAKLRAASVFAASGRLESEEKVLLQARIIVRSDLTCSADMVRSVYERLFVLELLKNRKPSLTAELLDEILDIRPRLNSDNEFQELLVFSFGQADRAGLASSIAVQKKRYESLKATLGSSIMRNTNPNLALLFDVADSKFTVQTSRSNVA